MSEIGAILGFGLQEIRRKRGIEARTMAELLRERMDGNDRVVRRRKSLTERLGFTGSIACCGTTLCLRPASLSVVDDDDDDGEQSLQPPPEAADVGGESTAEVESANLLCLGHIPAGSGMNLAAALLAERNFRAGQDTDDAANTSPSPDPGPNTSSLRPNSDDQGTPYRMSLMRLLGETNGWDEKEELGVGNDRMCCVCMGRKKGAAFIPCGHTYCRVCSRELWLNRGYCPLCNRSILEILDIY